MTELTVVSDALTYADAVRMTLSVFCLGGVMAILTIAATAVLIQACIRIGDQRRPPAR